VEKRRVRAAEEEGEPEPEPQSQTRARARARARLKFRPAKPSPAIASEAFLAANKTLRKGGVSVFWLELWSCGDWSNQRALQATHGRWRRARVSSAQAKTCMRATATPAGGVSDAPAF
jgi:hypothetical protein